MKLFTKIIFIALLAVSTNAMAQNKPNSMSMGENLQNFKGVIDRKITDNLTASNKRTTSGKLIALVDSIYYWKWDTLARVWSVTPFDKDIDIIYDSHNNETNEVEQSKNGASWVNLNQYTNTFDSVNNWTSQLTQNWFANSWVKITLESFNYNITNGLTNVLNQSWSGTAWTDNWQYIYTRDTSNRVTTTVYQTWSGTAWANNSQFINYVYNVNNKPTSILEQAWNGSAWHDTSNYTYAYDVNNNNTNQLIKNWNGTAWVNYLQYIFTYDANNNNTSELIQVWNGSTWVNYLIYTYGYDANNLEKTNTFKVFDNTGSTVVFGDSAYFYFHTATGINEVPVADASIIVYPNPASNQLTIHPYSFHNKAMTVSIINLLGEVMQEEKTRLSNDVSMDIKNLSAGIYILQLQSERGSVIKKFVKE